MFASRKPAAAARRIGSVPAMQIAPLLHRLRRDQSGNVAMLFGLLLIPLVALIGLAVDFGRVYSVTSHTQAALDAAALAAGRAALSFLPIACQQGVRGRDGLLQPGQAERRHQLDAAVFPQLRQHAVHRHRHLVGEDAVPERPQFALSQNAPRRSTCWLPVERLRLRRGDEHRDVCPLPERCLHGQRGGGSNVEISLMLDVTGSMCSPCTKIEAVNRLPRT